MIKVLREVGKLSKLQKFKSDIVISRCLSDVALFQKTK